MQAPTTRQKDSVVCRQFDRPGWARMLVRMFLVMLAATASVVALGVYQHRRGRGVTGLADAQPAPSSLAEGQKAEAPVPTAPPPARPGQPDGGPPATPGPDAAAKPPAGPAAKPEAEPAVKPGVSPPVTPETAAAKPQAGPAAKAETVADPDKQASFRRGLAAARTALARHDFAAARRHVEAAAALAQNPAEEAEAARARLLLAKLQEFWKEIAKVVAGLTVAEEISAGETQYIVVAVTRDKLTLRSEGSSRTYDLRNLPRPVVEALARSGFAPHPSSKVLLGTYLALDPRGDRREARKLWEEARQQGEDVDALMAELEDAAERAGPPRPEGRAGPRRR